MKKIRNIILALAIITSGVFVNRATVYACDPQTDMHCVPICDQLDDEQKAAAGCALNSDTNVVDNVINIINVAITVVGILAVVMIVIAGQRFIVSSGDPNKITQAKNMLIYSIVGLVVAGLAFAIIKFVSVGLGNK